MNVNKLIKIGIILLLLFFGVYLAYRLIPVTVMRLNVRFTDSPPTSQSFLTGGINAYYRGYKVGKVSDISLSGDQKYIVYHLDIHYKNLKLPRNTAFNLKSEPILGSTARYFTIDYPRNPSSELLTDGDTIHGAASFQGLDQFLVEEIPKGSLGKLVNNLIFLTGSLKSILKTNGNLNDTLTELNKLSINANYLLSDVNEFIDDPELKEQLKRTIKKSPESIDNIERNLELTTRRLPEINRNIVTTNRNIVETNQSIVSTNGNIVKTNTSIIRTNNTLCGTNANLYATNCNLGTLNSKIPQIPPELLNNTSEALETLNCVGNELSEILNKRFLLLRFLFGKPASSISKCLQDDIECKPMPEEK